MHKYLTALAIAILTACSHPLEITGYGDILSATGDRDCLYEDYLADAPGCADNWVASAYHETYFAVPRPGWQFDSWLNYCVAPGSDSCTFNIDVETVALFAGDRAPALHARFAPEGCPPLGSTEFVAPVDWGRPPSQTRIPLADNVSSMEFITTRGTGYGGQISIASTTGNSGVQRHAWISTCPAGEPLADPKCEQFGTSSTVIKWYQGPEHRSYCNLTPLTRYYLNIENLTCTTGRCDVYRNLYNNGNP